LNPGGEFNALFLVVVRPRSKYNGSMKLFPVLILLCLTACRTTPRPTATTSAASYGSCSDPVDVRLDPDGRRVHLLVDVSYVDPAGIHWLAPKGSIVDGASIPQPFWSIIGGPWEGKYRFASILHDVACDEKKRPWDQSATMFYNAMRCSGVNDLKAKTMYYAVYEFGPHWPAPGVMGALSDAFGSGPRKTVAARPPKRASKEDVRRIQAFVKSKNPTLKEIETDASHSSH
jgi:Protein of unknown function (DUF1353)